MEFPMFLYFSVANMCNPSYSGKNLLTRMIVSSSSGDGRISDRSSGLCFKAVFLNAFISNFGDSLFQQNEI